MVPLAKGAKRPRRSLAPTLLPGQGWGLSRYIFSGGPGNISHLELSLKTVRTLTVMPHKTPHCASPAAALVTLSNQKAVCVCVCVSV